MSYRSRAKTAGHVAGQRQGVARPQINSDVIEWALSKRPRTSWQALGKQVGLNAEDLRRACERVEKARG